METNTENKGIMDCSDAEALQFCETELRKYDDLQQYFADKGDTDRVEYFVDAFNTMEHFYIELKKGQDKYRNYIRMIAKDAYKMAASEVEN